ncbi:hypothetical protein HDU76_012081, partial [Blyttiomyces sp. JEL0837]
SHESIGVDDLITLAHKCPRLDSVIGLMVMDQDFCKSIQQRSEELINLRRFKSIGLVYLHISLMDLTLLVDGLPSVFPNLTTLRLDIKLVGVVADLEPRLSSTDLERLVTLLKSRLPHLRLIEFGLRDEGPNPNVKVSKGSLEFFYLISVRRI